MQAEQDVYQFIIDNVGSVVSRHTLEAVYTFVSPGCRTLLGYEPEELLGHSAYDFFHPADVAQVRQAHDETLLHQVARVAYRFRHKQGYYVWLETKSYVIADEATGEPLEIVATSNDITLFKETETALAQTVSLHQATLESTADGLLVVDINGRIVNYNQKFCDMWHIAQPLVQTLDDRKLLDYVLPQLVDPEAFLQKVQALYFEPEASSLDLLLFKDGRFFERYSQPQTIAGEVVGRVWSFRDVTQQHRAQTEARTNADRFQRLINQATDAIFLVDRQGNVLDANQRACLNLGYTREELLALTVFDFNQGLQPEIFAQMLADLAAAERVIIERTHQRKDGSTFPTEISVGFLETGEVLAIARDISKRAEAEERFRSLANASSEGIIIHDEGVVIEVNQTMIDMFGYGADEIVGHHVADLVPEEAREMTMQNLARQTDEPYETHFWHRDGYSLMVEVSGKIIPYRSKPMRVVTVRDVTQQKQFEEQAQLSLWRRTREMGIMTEIMQHIAGLTDLRELYQQVVTQVKERLDYYHVQLLLYDAQHERVNLVVGYGEIGAEMLRQRHGMPVGRGVIGTAVSLGASVLESDVAQAERWQANLLLPETRGELAVLIKLRHEILGVLDVQTDRPDTLDENDRILLEGLCGQVAIAIESTRLRQEMETQLRESAVLQRQRVQEGWHSWHDVTAAKPAYTYHIIDGQALPTEQENGRLPSSNVVKPLSVRGTAIGRLEIEADPQNPLSPEEEAILDNISGQIAEALDAARLFEQTQTALTVQERLAQELHTVSEVGTVAATIREANSLLQSVVDLTKVSFDLYHVHIYLMDTEGQELILAAGADQVGRMMVKEDQRIQLDDASTIAAAARRLSPVLVENAAESDTFITHPMLPHTQSELAVPMIVGNKLLGVLDVQADTPYRFTDEDVLINRTLASQVAVALQNAYHYDELVQAAERLREVDRLKTEFLASMSHELRTPLNSIIGFADVLLEGVDGELNELMEEDVKLIRDSGEHLRTLIDDILDMSKIEAGKMDLRYEPIMMYQMAHDIISTALPLAKEKGLKLDLLMENNDIIVEADRTRLRQILWNIVGNGIKFTKQGWVTLRIKTADNQLLVEVEDSGIGIRPEEFDIVFEQFRQVDGKLNREAGGTGLGMPISKNLVELHGGQIWVESQLGVGSTFFFTIPLRQSM